MSYTTPPTLSYGLQQELDSLAKLIARDYSTIAQNMFAAALQGAGTAPKVSLPPLVQLVDRIITPTIHQWEGLYVDHPNDSGGATCRGVIVTTFTQTFDKIFISYGTQDVKNAVRSFNQRRPTWKSDLVLAKQVLYGLAKNEKVAGLWIVKFLCDPSCRYPIAVMAEDPFLGFFLAECCWGSGAGCYTTNGFDTVARQYGWNGSTSQWVSFIAGLGKRTPEFASKLVEKRLQFILNISKPESKNSVFRKGWLRRLVNDSKNSDISMMVKINELFNLNTEGAFNLSQAELAHLKVKAESYKSFSINVPS